MSNVFLKDPDAVLDYSIDWSQWLPTLDTISTSNWTVPTGITEDSSSNSATIATIMLSGGTLNNDYELVNRIVTAGGRTQDQTIRILVRSR